MADHVDRKEYNDLMNELYEFTESYIEFNGCDVLGSDSVTIDSDNNKDLKSKNSSLAFDSNCSDSKSNAICSTNDKNIVKSKDSRPPNIPVYSLNSSDWKISSSYPTNDVPIVSYSIQLVVPQIPQNTSHVENNTCKLQTIPPVLNVQSNTDQRSSSVDNDLTIVDNSNYQCPKSVTKAHNMSPKQILLLKHQLTQYVQIVTQSYVLCTMEKTLFMYRRKFKASLSAIQNKCKNKKYEPINIHSSLRFINDWNDFCHTHKETNKKDFRLLPTNIKEFMFFYQLPVFIYPQLLPTRTFHHGLKSLSTFPIPSEEKFLILKIDNLFKKLKENKQTRVKFRKMKLSDMMPVILPIVHRRWFYHKKLSDLKKLLTYRKKALGNNIIKNYLVNGEIEVVSHIVDVGALFEGKCLYQCDIKKFPFSWQSFVNYG